MKTDTNSTASLERSTYAADFAQRVYVNQAKLSSGTKAILRLHHLWFGLLQFDGSGERAGMQLVLLSVPSSASEIGAISSFAPWSTQK